MIKVSSRWVTAPTLDDSSLDVDITNDENGVDDELPGKVLIGLWPEITDVALNARTEFLADDKDKFRDGKPQQLLRTFRAPSIH